MLLCLRYITYQNGLPIIHETFFDSLHINSCLTGQTIGKNILFLLENNEINIRNVELKHVVVQVL